MAVHRSGLGRLRNNFSAVLDEQVAALVWLAREAQTEPDLLEPLAAELSRIEETAKALDLVELAHAAQQARAAVNDGGAQQEIQTLLAVCRTLDGKRPVFRPLLVLEPDVDSAMRLRMRARSCAVQVDFLDTVDALLESARGTGPFAAVVPHGSLKAVVQGFRETDRLATVPIYVFSAEEPGLAARSQAASLGAAGWVRTPLDIPAMLWRIRHQLRDEDLRGASVLACGPQCAERLEALAPQLKAQVTTLPGADALLEQLDAVGPDLVVLDALDAAPLLAALRGHEHWHRLAIAVYGDATQAQVPKADLLLSTLPDASLVHQIQGRVDRHRCAAGGALFDSDTGVMSRNAFLSASDRQVGLSLRTGEPTAACLLELDGHERLVAERGKGGADLAMRQLAHSLQAAIRETDVVGRVGPWTLGVLLIGCNADQATRRVGGIQEGFAALDPENSDALRFTGGVADTLHGPALLQRAETALHRARVMGPGNIGT